MSLLLVDRDGQATIAAADGQAALGVGDTPRAREKYAEAGAILEKNIASVRRQSEKHLTRFLAATQYYKGGDYQKALELCQKIEQRLLPPGVKHLFPKFLQDVRSRASAGYQSQVRQELRDLWGRKDHHRILQLLQEHPYVLARDVMALIRAVISESLKNYRAAALFYADAVRLNPDDPNLVFSPAAVPLTAFSGDGSLQEAWDYVRHQLELLPHPVTHVVASLLCFRRALKQEGEEREKLLEDQVGYFEQARAGFVRLPSRQQTNGEIRGLMALGYEVAASGLRRLGDLQRARMMCDEAIAFEPNTPEPWVQRGLVRYPEAGALDDFREAIARGDDTYFPYYFLAHDALTKDDFRSALSWTQQALQKKQKPGARIESQLYGWMAICRDQEGANREEVEGLFRKAREIDPANEEVENNYRLYLNSLNGQPARTTPAWDRGRVRGIEDQFVLRRQSDLSNRFNGTSLVSRELETAGV